MIRMNAADVFALVSVAFAVLSILMAMDM